MLDWLPEGFDCADDLDWPTALAHTVGKIRAAPVLRPSNSFDCLDIGDFYRRDLYACLVRHYPRWEGPGSVRERAAAAERHGELPEQWSSREIDDRGNRGKTLPGAEGARMGFMAFNVSEPLMDRCGLLDEDSACFWRAYRAHFSSGALQNALVDKFNTTIRRRFIDIDNRHRARGATDAEARHNYEVHRETIALAKQAPSVSLRGADSIVALRATGGGPNGYQGFTGGVHGEDQDRLITSLSYIAERPDEPAHLGMSIWRSATADNRLLGRDPTQGYALQYEGLWRPNAFFAFAGCLESWHCASRDANRCTVGGDGRPVIDPAKWAQSKRNMLQTLFNVRDMPKSQCLAETGQASVPSVTVT